MKERMIVWIVAWVTLLTAIISVLTFCSVSPRWDETLAEYFLERGFTPEFASHLEEPSA